MFVVTGRDGSGSLYVVVTGRDGSGSLYVILQVFRGINVAVKEYSHCLIY